MATLALVVEYETHPGSEEVFLAAMRAHANACLAEEPGCFRFEVLRPRRRERPGDSEPLHGE